MAAIVAKYEGMKSRPGGFFVRFRQCSGISDYRTSQFIHEVWHTQVNFAISYFKLQAIPRLVFLGKNGCELKIWLIEKLLVNKTKSCIHGAYL